MSTTDFLGIAGQNKVRIAGIAVISAALPVTVYMALTPQSFQNIAVGEEVANLKVNPKNISTDVVKNSVPIQAYVYNSGGSITNTQIFYEWEMNLESNVGTLSKVTGNTTELLPTQAGCAQITVTATGGEKVLTETVNVTVKNGTYIPEC